MQLHFPSALRPFRQIAALCAILFLCVGCGNAYLNSLEDNPWEVVTLPVDTTVLDVAFIDSQHGWAVGKKKALLETTDGGATWEVEELPLDGEQVYNLNSVSFEGEDGWIVGEPSLLLHTTDGGDSWERVPLSDKLPGTTDTITALGTNQAEMTTDVGAIYRTEDGGYHWKAMVEQAVGVYRNINRSPSGEYVTVSARGNFYSTWKPGQNAWEQHNRESSRRLQSMGFGGADGQLWMLARGGLVRFSDPDNVEEWGEAISPEFSTSWGLLDLAYRTPEEIWVSGGSGNLLRSTDGGETWLKDRAVEDVPTNLYKIVFLNPEQGFVLGQGNTMLRYVGTANAA
ncbi:MAG: photosynthesis system II assembly factor Ycf48 [Cyanobacteria bacterium P01_A01_bin.135]